MFFMVKYDANGNISVVRQCIVHMAVGVELTEFVLCGIISKSYALPGTQGSPKDTKHYSFQT